MPVSLTLVAVGADIPVHVGFKGIVTAWPVTLVDRTGFVHPNSTPTDETPACETSKPLGNVTVTLSGVGLPTRGFGVEKPIVQIAEELPARYESALTVTALTSALAAVSISKIGSADVANATRTTTIDRKLPRVARLLFEARPFMLTIARVIFVPSGCTRLSSQFG
jgi:hypothetical protein